MVTLWRKYSYVIIFIVFTFLLGLYVILYLEKNSSESFQPIILEEGDNLWTLANTYAEEHKMSTDHFISWAQKENELLDLNVQAGQEIIIPIKEQKIKTNVDKQLAIKSK